MNYERSNYGMPSYPQQNSYLIQPPTNQHEPIENQVVYYCSDVTKKVKPIEFKPLQPNPWASLVDIITASQYIEFAIHSTQVSEVQKNINTSKKWLCHALVYLQSAIDSHLQPVTSYRTLQGNIQYALNVITMVEKDLSQITSTSELNKFLTTKLYSVQGYMGYLSKNITMLM